MGNKFETIITGMQVYGITAMFICLTAQRPGTAMLHVTKHTETTV